METYEAFVDGDPTGILVRGYSAEAAWDKAVEEVMEEYPECDELEVVSISDSGNSYMDTPRDRDD